MQPDMTKPATAGRRPPAKGKRTLVVTAGIVVLLVLLALAALRPIVDRRDGPEEEPPTVVTPAISQTPTRTDGASNS
ncbi:MAG: hypothetical protein KY446_11570 [Proteobacteria bacterium]|nr:hypothetical protein [Pseudomonadota bacterium]MBW3618356.1 hypothetical protein [Pseudomonadota bacterium]